MAYFYLLIAVVFETIGTSALQASQQFSRLVPSVIVVTAYAASFFFMAIVLRYLPVGITYAIWSGLGIVLIAAIGFVVFGQRLDWPAILGMAMILGGILIIHLYSKSAVH